VMLIFQSPQRISPGMKQRVEALSIRLANVQTETLDDLYQASRQLGELVNETEKAEAFVNELRARLEEIENKTAGEPPVRTLIFTSERATGAVGRETFLNDLLEVAGGVNVLENEGWLTLDRERISALKPEAVIVLLGGVPEHVEAETRRAVEVMGDLPAVKEGRVLVINAWHVLQP